MVVVGRGAARWGGTGSVFERCWRQSCCTTHRRFGTRVSSKLGRGIGPDTPLQVIENFIGHPAIGIRPDRQRHA